MSYLQGFEKYFGGEDEIRTRGQDCSRRRFSKPVVSATHPPLHFVIAVGSVFDSAKLRIVFGLCKFFGIFFTA